MATVSPAYALLVCMLAVAVCVVLVWAAVAAVVRVGAGYAR